MNADALCDELTMSNDYEKSAIPSVFISIESFVFVKNIYKISDFQCFIASFIYLFIYFKIKSALVDHSGQKYDLHPF